MPAFVKVMGIALRTTVRFGGGMTWGIHRELDQRSRKLADEVGTHLGRLSKEGWVATRDLRSFR